MKEKITLCFFALAVAALMTVTAKAQPSFTAALNSAQLVPPTNSTGRATCTAALTNDEVTNLSCEYADLPDNLYSAIVWAEEPFGTCGASVRGGTSGSFSLRCIPPYGPPRPNLSALLRKSATVRFYSYSPWIPMIQGTLKIVTFDSDVDGDAHSDAFLYRPSQAHSYTLCSVDNSMMSHQFEGQPNDSDPFLADFDGDGLADHAFTRVDASGNILTLYFGSHDHTMRQVGWGNTNLGDEMTFGDYDADRKMDVAVFRPSDGIWYVLQSSDNQPHYGYWGMVGDRACAGDYDKDGKTDLCVVRGEDGRMIWYIRRSSDGGLMTGSWGLTTDTLYQQSVDVDGDGASDLLVSRDENGYRVFYALRSLDQSVLRLQWGLTTDAVRLNDYDGDGMTDFVSIRSDGANLIWYVNQSHNGQMHTFVWGLPGDK